jgi:hypothetical protein
MGGGAAAWVAPLDPPLQTENSNESVKLILY